VSNEVFAVTIVAAGAGIIAVTLGILTIRLVQRRRRNRIRRWVR
jgi:hypothetical protein